MTDFFRAQPDFESWRPALTLGKLNVAKWILMRGFSPSDYRMRLFTSDDAPIGLAQRLYAAALRTELMDDSRPLTALWMPLTMPRTTDKMPLTAL